MKINKQGFWIYFLLIVVFASAQVPEQPGFLSIKADSSQSVFIDSLFIGKGSFASISIATGPHLVQVRNVENPSWSNRGFYQSIHINAGENKLITVDTVQLFTLRSIPYNSKVFVEETPVGFTPLTVPIGKIDQKQIRLEKDGYETTRVFFSPGLLSHSISLRPLQSTTPPLVIRSEDHGLTLKWQREGLVLGSLLSSWLSFYLKREADHYYDKYQQTSDIRLIRTYSDRIRKYDRLSDYAIGVSITTLGVYLYFLLWE